MKVADDIKVVAVAKITEKENEWYFQRLKTSFSYIW
jgi:hypothetical protein